jgi:hypothetical protein
MRKKRMYRCGICGKMKQSNFWVCKECAVEYSLVNLPYFEWPEWVKYLVSCERKQARIDEKEIVFSDLSNEFIENYEIS